MSLHGAFGHVGAACRTHRLSDFFSDSRAVSVGGWKLGKALVWERPSHRRLPIRCGDAAVDR